MKLRIAQVVDFTIPEILEEDVKDCLKRMNDETNSAADKKEAKDYLEEMIGDIDYRYGSEYVDTLKIEVVRVRDARKRV